MGMRIGSKLDFLMKTTGTSNSALGRALSFDASYISRLRSDKRGIPKDREFIIKASDYFARHADTNIQKGILSQVILGGKNWPADVKVASSIIYAWMNDPAPFSEDYVRGSERSGKNGLKAAHENKSEFYFGNEGKRQAVLEFLNELDGSEAPCTLMLYSDEAMEWLYEDATFAVTWMRLMQDLLEKGYKIKIIHTVGRNIQDMFEAIRKWMPLYMSGNLEPYYCPRLRDDVNKRTRFIAHGKCALIASSVGSETNGMLNCLIHDRMAVKSLEKEFRNFLKICQPLMKVYGSDDKAEQTRVLKNFGKHKNISAAMISEEYLKHAGNYSVLLDNAKVIVNHRIPEKCLVVCSEKNDVLVIYPDMSGNGSIIFRITEENLCQTIAEFICRQ